MSIKTERFFTRTEVTERAISRWAKIKGFKLSVVTLSEPTFRTTINLVLGEHEEFKKYVLQQHQYVLKTKNPAALYMRHEDGATYILLNPRVDFTASDYGEMVHELHHFAHDALDRQGMDYTRDGEEAFAYVQGYYMELMCRALVILRKTVKVPKKA
jgi:hypothetical protein